MRIIVVVMCLGIALDANSQDATEAEVVDASGEVERDEPDARESEARVTFEAATIAFSDGRFEDALSSFRRAYELSPRAELLYNMGQCTDRLRRDAETVDYFERYLEAAPDAANRRTVESRIEVLRERVLIERSEAEQAERADLDARVAATVVDEPAPRRRWWLGALIGVVVVGAGVGVYFAVADRGGVADPTRGDVGPGGIVEALRW